MNLRRFAVTVAILGGGFILVGVLASQEADRSEASRRDKAEPTSTAPATRPATKPATRPAPAPAWTAPPPAKPATRPAPAAVRPAATGGQKQWDVPVAGPRLEPDKPSKHLIGSLDARSGYTLEVETRTDGAAINTIKLAKYFASVHDKRFSDKDPDAYEEARTRYDEAFFKKYKGHYSLLNPIKHGGVTYLPLATRSITVHLPNGDSPRWDLYRRSWYRMPASGTQPAEQMSVRYAWALQRNPNHDKPEKPQVFEDFLTVYKTYTVLKNDYDVRVDLEVVNHTRQPLKIELDQMGPVGIPLESVREDARSAGYARIQEDGKIEVNLDGRGELEDLELAGKRGLSSKDRHKQWQRALKVVGQSDEAEPVLWIGEVNRFFASMLYLKPKEGNRLQASSYQAKFYYAAAEETATSRTFLTGVQTPAATVKPGEKMTLSFNLFAGPKRRQMFVEPADKYYKDEYQALGYDDTVAVSGCPCAIDWMVQGMMWLLRTLSVAAFGNYGVAIILLVLMVRLALHPLTKRGQLSMMKMQKLGPKMKELEAKHKGDKEAMNREKIKLFKEGGATPLLGCLPMLLQMPIWIALWTGINAAIELRHSAFLPFWIIDLAAPDALFKIPTITVPFFNTELTSFNFLPILLAVAMFLQTKLNPSMTGGQAAATPEQEKQQKMMRIMMPCMMLFIFYNAPAGLTLYIMASTFAGVAEQFVIRKHIKDKEEAEAALATTVTVPGRGPRASRQKKPKGPFWTKRG